VDKYAVALSEVQMPSKSFGLKKLSCFSSMIEQCSCFLSKIDCFVAVGSAAKKGHNNCSISEAHTDGNASSYLQ
jgi:hypothetical protein